jgi:hypothetical protein
MLFVLLFDLKNIISYNNVFSKFNLWKILFSQNVVRFEAQIGLTKYFKML